MKTTIVTEISLVMSDAHILKAKLNFFKVYEEMCLPENMKL